MVKIMTNEDAVPKNANQPTVPSPPTLTTPSPSEIFITEAMAKLKKMLN